MSIRETKVGKSNDKFVLHLSHLKVKLAILWQISKHFVVATQMTLKSCNLHYFFILIFATNFDLIVA
jgi:hypothetical protein